MTIDFCVMEKKEKEKEQLFLSLKFKFMRKKKGRMEEKNYKYLPVYFFFPM